MDKSKRRNRKNVSKNNNTLSSDTEIEVVSQHKKTGKTYLKKMTINDWQNLEKKPEFNYKAFQLGYQQYVKV